MTNRLKVATDRVKNVLHPQVLTPRFVTAGFKLGYTGLIIWFPVSFDVPLKKNTCMWLKITLRYESSAVMNIIAALKLKKIFNLGSCVVWHFFCYIFIFSLNVKGFFFFLPSSANHLTGNCLKLSLVLLCVQYKKTVIFFHHKNEC